MTREEFANLIKAFRQTAMAFTVACSFDKTQALLSDLQKQIMQEYDHRFHGDGIAPRINEIVEMRVIKDGDRWMFVLPEFKNLQESKSSWCHEWDSDLDGIYEDLTRVDDHDPLAA